MKIGLFGICYLMCLPAFAQGNIQAASFPVSVPEEGNKDHLQDVAILKPEKCRSDTAGRSTVLFDEEEADRAMEVAYPNEIIADHQTSKNGRLSFSVIDYEDIYLSQTGPAFSRFGFRPRGQHANERVSYINGVLINDLAVQVQGSGLWSGLNTVFRDHLLTRGLSAATEGFGGLTGLNVFNITAAHRNRASRVAYSVSNADCRNRLMLSYCSGRLSNGWALAATMSKRWSETGYVPGTFYNGYSYYFALSRKLGENNSLHFTAFGSSVKEGMAVAATLEAMELAGTPYYNPAWGYQEGEIRNARVARAFQPVFLLNYKWEPDTVTRLNIAAGFRTGHSGYSGLDWYNAQDPRPDNYRNLPGYYLYNPDEADPETADAIRQEWLNDPAKAQINWKRMYEANAMNWETINGVYGKRSLYVVGADREDAKKYSLDVHFQKAFGNKIFFYCGLNASSQRTERYRKMLDLLGGDYFVNLNQFAERTYAGNTLLHQQDLNHPDQLIKNGDKYNYHYWIHLLSGQIFSQVFFTLDRFAFFLAADLGWVSFSREGLYKNGLFPDNSYGKSEVEKFLIYKGKAGIQYSLSRQHILFVNGAYGTQAPAFDAVFYAPRNRNAILSQPVNEHFLAAEGGYGMYFDRVQSQITFFVSDIKDRTEVLHYYNEAYRNLVNYAMQGVNIRHLGLELAFQVKLLPCLSAGAAASWMQVFYSSRPEITVYPDNDTTSEPGKDIVYWKNNYAGSGPQSAYTLSLKYTPVRYGFLRCRINYLHRAYVSLNPARFTEDAVGTIPVGSEQWSNILDQKQLPAIFTLDMTAGKSFDLKKIIKGTGDDLFLHIGVGVNNILNNKNIRILGYQQLRFDYSGRFPEKFPNKYRYGYGRTWYLNLSFKF